MKKFNIKKIAITTTFIAALFIVFTFFTYNSANAASNYTQTQIFSRVGQILDENPSMKNYLKASNKNNIVKDIMPLDTNSNQNSNNTVVAEVNGWPITTDEIDYRTAMLEASGQSHDSNHIFNLLVEEKVKLSQAQAYGVLPTMLDINNKINNYYKQEMKNNSDYKQTVNLFIQQSGITQDDYWQAYEMYNEFRVTAFTNLSNAIIKEGKENGLIAPDGTNFEDMSIYKFTDSNKYYFNKVLELKKNATVKIMDGYSRYTPILNKIFMFYGAIKESITKNDIDNMKSKIYSNQVGLASNKISTNYTINSVTANITKTVSATPFQWSGNYGAKSFPYKMSLYAYQFNTNGQQKVWPMDIIIYRTTQYDPAIEGDVGGFLTSCKAFNPSGVQVANLLGTFTNSLYWFYTTPYGLVYGKGSTGATLGASGSYKIQVSGGLAFDGDWFPGIHTTSLDTSYF